ncbi:hypothetical protein GZH47_30545 [Paenibacillus rhizovicinus]|uniref:Uncharacterized protein n=1 Tax=Paenibacillus rhizovicinus TaxID=2704463 RepID=A0A6C0P7Z7_9BACL|nr:beta-galactosidase [Paenibacillus rhizovicinus]QHW34707.1 hypothetical protein GZH47_30545 [Paenibacillus rhizovicinus]
MNRRTQGAEEQHLGSMEPIAWDRISYTINGKRQFLISGEFHYFRVPARDWRERLERFREAGGNCVATYIPWILHEPAEGDIRFGDKPERDLERFLALCGELGLYVICRPGPYQYSEMKYCGLPPWLIDGYPDILARTIDGHIMVRDSVSYLHPVFLAKVKAWFNIVCPIIAAYATSKGGPVAFVQFDNELTGIHEWFGGWDYHPETMGFGREEGRYTAFLRNKYRTVERLNAAYGTAVSVLADMRPISSAAMTSIGDRRRVKDYQDFYFGTIAEYAVLLTGWMRESGIDGDFIHNSANPGSNGYHAETVERLGSGFILGSDHYYNLDLDWNANNPTPKYAVNALLSHEMLRHYGFPSTIYELPGGSPSDWPPITADDLSCCYWTNIAFGMKGFNYYVFAGGYNPEGIGGDGEVYDYQAAIAPDNAIRPHYYAQKRFGALLQEHSWLVEAERAVDFYIGLDREHSRSSYYAAGHRPFGNADAWTFLSKGLLMTSLCASYSPELLDLYSDNAVNAAGKPILVAASACMAANVQQRLVNAVKRGGKLLLAPVIPQLDENFNPCTILKDFLDGAEAEPFTASEREVRVGSIPQVYVNQGLWVSAKLPEGASVIAEEKKSGGIAGWKKRYPNGGCVIWLGIQWKFTKYGHMDMLRELLNELGGDAPAVRCDNPNLWTALRSDGSSRMLFVMNLFASPMEADVSLRLSDGQYAEPIRCCLKPMEVQTLLIDDNGAAHDVRFGRDEAAPIRSFEEREA